MQSGYLQFIRENTPFLATGVLLSLLSCFGQTFFIAIFSSEIRDQFNLSNGDWGLIYMGGTGASAVAMIWAGGLADQFRVRTLGIFVTLALALTCFAMSLNGSIIGLVVIIFFLRFLGQGMLSHVSVVAMARWFVATRGRAVAIAGLGFMLGEATLPLTMVWLKSLMDWQTLWLGFSIICIIAAGILFFLLRLERTPQSIAIKDETVGIGARHWTRSEALRHPLFWLMVPAVIFFSAFGTVFWFQQVNFAEAKGWPHLSLVAIFPLGTAALGISAVFYGWAIDKLGAVRLLPYYILPYILAFSLHWASSSLAMTAFAVVLMGIAGGGHSTLMVSAWAEFYGTRHLGSIKAATAALMVLGSALGPGISGVLIDRGVGIEIQMLGYAACFVLAGVLQAAASRMAIRLAAA